MNTTNALCEVAQKASLQYSSNFAKGLCILFSKIRQLFKSTKQLRMSIREKMENMQLILSTYNITSKFITGNWQNLEHSAVLQLVLVCTENLQLESGMHTIYTCFVYCQFHSKWSLHIKRMKTNCIYCVHFGWLLRSGMLWMSTG